MPEVKAGRGSGKEKDKKLLEVKVIGKSEIFSVEQNSCQLLRSFLFYFIQTLKITT